MPGGRKPPAIQTKERLTTDPFSLNSPGWTGEECEELWARAVTAAIANKREKLGVYQKCHQYWLILHDTWDMSFMAKLPEAIRYLVRELAQVDMGYNEVYILQGRALVRVDHNTIDLVYTPREIFPNLGRCLRTARAWTQ